MNNNREEDSQINETVIRRLETEVKTLADARLALEPQAAAPRTEPMRGMYAALIGSLGDLEARTRLLLVEWRKLASEGD